MLILVLKESQILISRPCPCVKIGRHVLQNLPFTQPQNSLLYNAFQLARDPKIAPFRGKHVLHSYVVHVPWTHLTRFKKNNRLRSSC